MEGTLINTAVVPPPKGAACAPCRSVKKKCDTVLPRCGRCTRQNLQCYPQPPALTPRRRRIDVLEEKMLALEAVFRSFRGNHDRELLCQSLADRVRGLSTVPPSFAQPNMLPMFPDYSVPGAPHRIMAAGDVMSNEENGLGYTPVVESTTLSNLLQGWDPRRGPTDPKIALYLVRIFLPFRIQFNFYMDVPYLLEMMSRSPQDPSAFHPALLNAICFGGTCVGGGHLAAFDSFFLEETRRQLHKCLEDADRLLHFLWATVVFAACLAAKGKLVEAYAQISSAAKFALACGLDGITTINNMSAPQYPLLPLPVTEEEATDRKNLAYSIYMTDRTVAMASGFPSAFSTCSVALKLPVRIKMAGSPESDESSPSATELNENLDGELHNLVNGDTPAGVLTMQLYERVESLARRVERSDAMEREAELRAEFKALEYAHSAFSSKLPSLLDTEGIYPFETIDLMNPALANAHMTFHGSVQLLYTLYAAHDREARDRALEAARAIADVCAQCRGSKGLVRVRAFVTQVFFVLNAIRVLGSYLVSPEAKQNSRQFAMCTRSIAVLVDYVFDLNRLYGHWGYLLPYTRGLLPSNPEALAY